MVLDYTYLLQDVFTVNTNMLQDPSILQLLENIHKIQVGISLQSPSLIFLSIA